MRLKAIGVVLFIALGSLGIFYGWQELKSLMFTGNSQYQIKKLKISTKLAVTPAEVKTYTGIQEGVNIFSFSAEKARTQLLQNVPNLSEVTIVKRLPDEVEIKAFDRLPVLRLKNPSFASDKNGTVMILDEKQNWHSLPRLVTFTQKQNPVPGQTLEGKASMALEIVNVYNEMDGISFKLNSIDIDGKVYVILQTSDGRREIRLVWEELISKADIRQALKMASETLAQPKAAGLVRFDVLLSTKQVYGR